MLKDEEEEDTHNIMHTSTKFDTGKNLTRKHKTEVYNSGLTFGH